VASLPGVATYFALKILAEQWSLFSSKGTLRVFAVVGALFLLLLFTNHGIVGAASAPTWSYATLPFSFALFVRYVNNGSLKDVLLLGLSSIFAIADPIWMYLIVITGLPYLIIEMVLGQFNARTALKRWTSVALAISALNSFWLIPSVAGFVAGAGGIFQTYTTGQLISLDSLRFLSHWTLLDVTMVGEHSYNFFWLHPQNYGPLNAAIPILAITSVLAFRKKRHVLFMALILAVGIFLTKGAHEPGGHLYYLLANSLPYAAGAILRNPTKFVPLVSFTYAFLVGLSIAKLYEKLMSIKGHPKLSIKSRFISYGVTAGLMLLVFTPVTCGTLVDLQGYTWPRYKPAYLPRAYDELNSWLSKQLGDFKVIWIPSGGSYVWKPYTTTAFPDLLSPEPAVSFGYIWPEPLKSGGSIQNVLTSLGVKYVIFHGDSLDYADHDILGELKKQSDLKPVLYLNYTYTPEENSNDPLPVEQKDIEFENVPLKVMRDDRVLPRGKETNITLYYEIPDSMVEQGSKGRFWDGFGMKLEVFPAGSVDLGERVWESLVLEQKMVDEEAGYAIFDGKIPYSYPGTAVDVYANIYGGSFRPLSPLYYAGRFEIEPSYINVPFIVFENEKYTGPIYIAQGTANIVSHEHISPVEWTIRVNSTSPYTIIFTEPYDTLWKAYVRGTQLSSVSAYGAVNSFAVNVTGSCEIRLHYTLQDYFLWGSATSMTTAILCVLYISKNKIATTYRRYVERSKCNN